MHRRYWLPGEEIPPAVVTSGGKEGELVMASVKYDIEVQVSRVSVSRLLSEYWNPDPVREACKLCPDYGKVWSCPPGVPEADDYLKPFREGFLIAVKVKYPEETRTLAVSAAKAQEIRNQTYEKVITYRRNAFTVLFVVLGILTIISNSLVKRYFIGIDLTFLATLANFFLLAR